MFPLRDNIPSQRSPVVVWLLVAINTVVFLWETQLSEAGLAAFMQRFALTPAALTAPGGFLQHWTNLLTHMFLHGGWLHLIGNMWYLWIFGDNVLDRYGGGRFLLLYIGGGLVASALQIDFNPDMQVPMVGASGAIAAVLGAYLILYPRAQVTTLIPIFVFIRLVSVPAVLWLGLWFVEQYFMGVGTQSDTAAGGGVAYWAHVGGFVFGMLVGIGTRVHDSVTGGSAGSVPSLRRRPAHFGTEWRLF